MCKCVLSPGDNPVAVNKYIILYVTGVQRNILPPFSGWKFTFFTVTTTNRSAKLLVKYGKKYAPASLFLVSECLNKYIIL